MEARKIITMGETMVSLTGVDGCQLIKGPNLAMRIAGAESNTAIGLRRLGHESVFISRVGTDSLGAFLRDCIAAEGVNISYLREDENHPTGLMLKELLPNGETTVWYYRNGSAASWMDESDVPESAIAEADLLHITGITPVLSESCLKAVQHAIQVAKTYGIPISFDPNIRKKLWKSQDFSPLIRDIIQEVTYLLTGKEELYQLYGQGEVETICKNLLNNSSLRYIVVKDGANGAWGYGHEETVFVEPYECHPVDPVGAGDAFNAGFLAGMMEGKNLQIACAMGAICGAKATETYGDIESLPGRQVLEEKLNV